MRIAAGALAGFGAQADRIFPTPEERKRAGGFGVSYHVSYHGRPLSYSDLQMSAND